MYSHPQLNPYLNRFTTLWQDNANVKLEFTCKDGNVIVNLSHNVGGIEKVPEAKRTHNPNDENVLKKNVSLSQIVRLKKRAAERAAAEKCDVEKAKCIAEEAEKDAISAKMLHEKTKCEAEKAKNEAEESRNEAEKAKLKAEQVKTDAEQARGKAEQAKREAKQAISEAKQAISEAEQAKSEAEEAKAEAEKAKSKAKKAKRDSEKATSEATNVKRDAEEAGADTSYGLAEEPPVNCQQVDIQIKETGNTEQARSAQIKNVKIGIDSKTEALGPRKVGLFLMSGKLKLNCIEEDLEELQDNKVL